MNVIVSSGLIECWRPVAGYPYEVSSIGNIRRVGGALLKPLRHSNGYTKVTLCGETRRKLYIHRIVCEAFHGAPFSGAHADHINGDRKDNRADNLRWLTPEENRASRNLARGERSGKSCLTEADILAIRSAAHFRGFDAYVAKRLGVSRETVRDIRNSKAWRHVDARR